MPNRSLRPCSHPGCVELVKYGYCDKHKKKGNDTYNRDKKRQSLYDTARWKRIRKAHLIKHPWCEEHLKNGAYVLATDVDHIEPHKGDPYKFFNNKRQSLCHSCHAKKTREENNANGQGG